MGDHRECSTSQKMTGCYSSDRGIISVVAKIDHGDLKSGDSANIIVEIDNSQSKNKLTSVHFRITNTYEYKGNGYNEYEDKTIWSSSVQDVLPGVSLKGHNARSFEFKIGNLKPSCTGHLITNKYHLEIKNGEVELNSCCNHS